jgi:uncharacterized protein YbjT (DUF2867 family)
MADKDVIAIIGATGMQGGGVVRALAERGRFRTRALTRDPDAYDGPADEAVRADLTDPATLAEAFAGAYGAFVVTNFWEPGGIDEFAQGSAAAAAAKEAGVQHYVWSTLPNVEQLSGGRLHVPHFTEKARVDEVVRETGFGHTTFVEAPFYFQNLTSVLAPQTRDDGTQAWVLPIDPEARQVYMGDVADLGLVVAGAFENPDTVGDGTHVAMPGGRYSFRDVVDTLNAQGHSFGFQQVPAEVFNVFFPGAEEMSAMLAYFEEFSYFGPDADAKTAAGRQVAIGPFTDLEGWARRAMPAAS